MKFIRNLENLFEKYIEGFFNNKFSSGLQPVEIGKQLIRKMEDERTIGVSKIYAPNLYMIYLGNDDFDRISSYQQSICNELSIYVTEQAKNRQYTIIGIPIIEFYLDDSVAKGMFRIVSCFTEAIPTEKNPVHDSLQCEELSHTRIFDKVECIPLKQHSLHGVLTVVAGPDAGLKIDIARNRVNIGRRASNELPLTDLNTSRLQVYVVFEDTNHVLYDAKSLNGTYVNDQRVMRKVLESGDCIKIGNTVILYEVNAIA